MTNVLVVDDDPVSLLLVRHVLERQGYVVTGTDSVDSALALKAESVKADGESSFDLVICDYVMPGRNGLDLLESWTPGTPFVLLTGELNRDDLNDDRVEGVSAYLTKPVASAELESVVADLLDTVTSPPTPLTKPLV